MTATPGCVTQATLFQHPCVEDGVPPRTPLDSALRARAAAVCRSCPLSARCLYDAVVAHDVAGIAGGTTPHQRRQIRALLGIHVSPRGLDAVPGVGRVGGAVSRDEILRLRQAHPHATLDQIASRLGCSPSTVKRHLREERTGTTEARTPPAPPPSLRAVLDAAAVVRTRRRASSAA